MVMKAGDAEGRRARGRQARLGARAGGAAQLMRRQIEISNEVAQALTGAGDHILARSRATSAATCSCAATSSRSTATPRRGRRRDRRRELSELIEQGHEIAEGTIAAVTSALDQHHSPAEILEDVVWRHRSTKVAPKTVNQKRYVDSIRRNTITFGIGPAGTGKTFLAVAMAAARSAATRSTASSSPARPSRPASAWASCRATSWRRSTRTCGRCSTRCTT
jgi:phosphate starvation-inducible protein PhoH